jgi:replicative DNA helicase
LPLQGADTKKPCFPGARLFYEADSDVSATRRLADLRVPPHSLEAEQSVLGGLLLDNAAFDKIADVMAEGDFYRDEHKRIYRQIRKLLERGKPADAVTVAESLDQAGEGNATGGLAYLGELAANTPSAANIRRYAEIVRERAILRQLVTAGDEIAGSALNPLGRDPKNCSMRPRRRSLRLPKAVSATSPASCISTHC